MSKIFYLLQKIGVDVSQKKTESINSITENQRIKSPLPADMYFINSKIALIPFPTLELSEIIFNYLNNEYNSRHMIWNLSEYIHPTKLLSQQTIDFIFVGYPNPPLSVMYSIFNSIHS